MGKPPFQLTSDIVNRISKIQQILGELQATTIAKPTIKLRKENKIKTVHHSLAIEGNSLTEEQITAILESKRVVGPKAQILEVQNALHLYEKLQDLNPLSEKDLLKAHKMLMTGLISGPGRYRSTQVGILKGTAVSHVAPPAKQIPKLMDSLFSFLKNDKSTHWLIKACVFHYELEFIHPFEDGNGRMGRLWQQLLLMKHSPLFEYLSTETLIHKKQKEYYAVLEKCDRAGDSTAFIEFGLKIVLATLEQFQEKHVATKPKIADRIEAALAYFGEKSFSRKQYLSFHKNISTATASRDLQKAVQSGLLKMTGDKASASYKKVP